MKMTGRTVDFCGTKEKKEENEGVISKGKRRTPFSSPDLLSSSPLSFHTIFIEK
jgi:hypothetical protein